MKLKGRNLCGLLLSYLKLNVMKTLLISVTYVDNSGRYWADSTLKSKQVIFDESLNIHKFIGQLLWDVDYMKLSYNNKPISNIFIDTNEGTKAVGFVYRSQMKIERKKAFFDAWVTIKQVVDYDIEVINY